MKILHLCLADFYIDGYNYQVNNLCKVNYQDGNEVSIIASTETYIDHINIGYVKPSKYYTEYGVPIERIPYKRIMNDFVTVKFRKFNNLYERIDEIKPDIIMSHGLTYWSVLDVIKYVKKNKNVTFYADTHADFFTSGTNIISRVFLHGCFYRLLAKAAVPYLKKYFYITNSCKIFAQKEYGIPEGLMEFFPLGGEIPDDENYTMMREKVRKELGIDRKYLFVHAGKLEKNKKTDILINAFSKVKDLDAKLLVIGSISDDIREKLTNQFAIDNRVQYLGWKNPTEMLEILCASDLYCQPGKVSSIMQNDVSARCPVILYPHEDYKRGYDNGNILWAESEDDLYNIFKQIQENTISLDDLSEKSKEFAEKYLDYHRLAARLYER